MKKPIALGISAELDLPRVLAFCSLKSVQDFCWPVFLRLLEIYGAVMV